MKNTLEKLVTALAAKCPARLRTWDSRMAAKNIASDILGPLVPAGTLGWLAFPCKGEGRAQYAARAYYDAAACCSWAGGLGDGTAVNDAAAVASVQAVLAKGGGR